MEDYLEDMKQGKIKPIGFKNKTKNPNGSTSEPEWFKNWFSKFKKENDSRWDQQFKFNKLVNQFIKQQQKFNQEQQKFNKFITKRLDNIVTKNDLKE